jgi:predicted nucleic acid-binding protein
VANRIWTHRFVIGELACGNLHQREQILGMLGNLAHGPFVDHAEVLKFVERERLMGRGLGWVDVHLLASATLAHLTLWSLDRRLAKAARDLHVAPPRVSSRRSSSRTKPPRQSKLRR